MDYGEMGLWGIAVVLVVFIAIGIALLVQSFREERAQQDPDTAEKPRRGFLAGYDAYIGPVNPDHALLNPPLRIALELVASMCGFPGFGWMASTRVRIGLPLLVIGPAIVFGGYPAFLVLSGHIVARPLMGLEYLPYLSAISTSALAIAEVRRARERRHVAAH
jgi:hypothetical protein